MYKGYKVLEELLSKSYSMKEKKNVQVAPLKGWSMVFIMCHRCIGRSRIFRGL